MKIIKGEYNEAIVYTDLLDEKSEQQIKTMMDHHAFEGSKVRIMPDVHAGKGSVIGFTSTFQDKIIPNIVGVDIGCGMLTAALSARAIDLELFDKAVNAAVPSGRNIFKTPDPAATLGDAKFLSDVFAISKKTNSDFQYHLRSLGTLGGGNHFIEVNRSDDGQLYVVIHSGSRNFGLQVARYHQNKAIEKQNKEAANSREMTIEALKALGRESEIEEHLQTLKNRQQSDVLASLRGRDKKEYLNDMEVAIQFARLNRNIILHNIIANYQKLAEETFFVVDKYHTIHNYIEDGMIRKGAIKATKGTKVTIPMNMRDGSILAVGKGNPDWNFSAPHGAGRLMSRSQARKQINLQDYSDEMVGIYSTSVVAETLDEAPMAYKPMDSILSVIDETVIVLNTIAPIYNFKAKD